MPRKPLSAENLVDSYPRSEQVKYPTLPTTPDSIPPNKSPKSSAVLDNRTSLLEKIDPRRGFQCLLSELPGIAFFAKDATSRIIAANRCFFERFGFQSETEIVGKDDHDLFPAQLARHFRKDDAEVIRSGKPKLNIVELFFNRQGLPDWFITNKLPIFDRNNAVIGVMGTTQSYGATLDTRRPYLSIDRAVECIRQQFRNKLTVENLAQNVGISPRQLHRRFVETFGMSPQSFLMRVRIQAACEMIQSRDCQLSEVAQQCGFPDQSAFSQHFRKHIGQTPLRFQKEHRLRLRSQSHTP
jgi:AraC-like DNA-binding protein